MNNWYLVVRNKTKVIVLILIKDKLLKRSYLILYIGNKYKVINVGKNNRVGILVNKYI